MGTLINIVHDAEIDDEDPAHLYNRSVCSGKRCGICNGDLRGSDRRLVTFEHLRSFLLVPEWPICPYTSEIGQGHRT